MNGIDYTKQLSKDREYYQDAVQKTKNAAEKRIADVEHRADYVTNKQRDNFIEDKAELENHYQSSLNNLKEKTKDSLANNSNQFSKDIEKERADFTADSLKKSKDFDQRLNDIKSSYQKAFDSEKDRNMDLTNSQNKKYAKNVSDIQKDTEAKLATYQDRLDGAGANLKDQYGRERQQLVRAHENSMTDVYKESAQKRAELKDRIMTDLKKTKEVQSADLEHQKNYMQDRLATMQNKYEDHYQTMAKDYSEKNDALVSSQQRDAIKTNREHQDHIIDVQREYNKNLRNIELEKRRRDTGTGEFAEVVDRQQGNKDQSLTNNRIKHLNSELVEAQRRYQDKAMTDQDNFNQTLKTESTEATARLDRKLNEANANKIITVSKEREKAEQQVANREHQNLLNKSAYEQQLMLEKNSASLRMNKLKENFASSLKTLEEKHKVSLDDVTKISNKDKAEFVKKMQISRSNENYEMRREFDKMMNSTVEDYEQRLDIYQRENEYLKLTMNQKVQNIVAQTDKQLESQRKLFEDRRAADVRNQQVLMDQREHNLKRTMSEINTNYQKKIDKMQVENDTKLKLITNDYETKLKELRTLTAREMTQKDTNHNVERDSIKIAYEDEKARMISAYETQIEELKKGQKEQMEQLKDYKRLS